MNYKPQGFYEYEAEGGRSEIEYMDSVMAPHYDSVSRIDIEKFIFKLSMNEVVVLLFLAMGYKRKEVKEIMGYKNVQNINQIVMRLREKHVKEQIGV